MFGPERETVEAPARELQILSQVARLSRSGRPALDHAEVIDLLVEDQISLSEVDGKKLLIGGQYLRTPAQTRVRVDLDVEAIGEGGEAELHHDVFLAGHEKIAREGIRLAGGDRWLLSYDILVQDEAQQLVVQLYATAKSDVTLRVHQASLSMSAAEVTEERVEVLRDRLSTGPRR